MIVAIIPAKAKSSRLPNKNMHSLMGKPMIYYSINIAKVSKLIEDIYVSTDSDEIATYARKQGVKVIKRGPELGGETTVVDVYYHALNTINNLKVMVVVGIQPDHPDRTIDIDQAITYLLKSDYDDVITVDSKGIVNGSLRVMKAEALLNKKIARVATIVDDCTNIHNLDDLKQAEMNLSKLKKQYELKK